MRRSWPQIQIGLTAALLGLVFAAGIGGVFLGRNWAEVRLVQALNKQKQQLCEIRATKDEMRKAELGFIRTEVQLEQATEKLEEQRQEFEAWQKAERAAAQEARQREQARLEAEFAQKSTDWEATRKREETEWRATLAAERERELDGIRSERDALKQERATLTSEQHALEGRRAELAQLRGEIQKLGPEGLARRVSTLDEDLAACRQTEALLREERTQAVARVEELAAKLTEAEQLIEDLEYLSDPIDFWQRLTQQERLRILQAAVASDGKVKAISEAAKPVWQRIRNDLSVRERVARLRAFITKRHPNHPPEEITRQLEGRASMTMLAGMALHMKHGG